MSTIGAFLPLGFRHITDLAAIDHLLFLAALVAPYRWRDWHRLLAVASAFTIGHSVTLALAVSGVVLFPTAVIEFLIPLTILVTALPTLLRPAAPAAPSPAALLAGGFGLVHGAGFANYLRALFDGPIGLPLLAFNLGIELGQLTILATALTAFAGLDRLLALLPRPEPRRAAVQAAGPGLQLRAAAASAAAAAWAAWMAVERAPW